MAPEPQHIGGKDISVSVVSPDSPILKYSVISTNTNIETFAVVKSWNMWVIFIFAEIPKRYNEEFELGWYTSGLLAHSRALDDAQSFPES